MLSRQDTSSWSSTRPDTGLHDANHVQADLDSERHLGRAGRDERHKDSTSMMESQKAGATEFNSLTVLRLPEPEQNVSHLRLIDVQKKLVAS